jgi:exopolysaccharide biosynthesis polyprenyl glycosylphosphotransferase
MNTSFAPLPLDLTPQAAVRSGRRHRVLECVFDVLAVTVSWQVTIQLRLLLNPYMELKLLRRELLEVTPPLWIVLSLWIAAALWLGLYREPRRAGAGSTMIRVMESGTLFGAAIIVVSFFSREMGAGVSRGFVLLFLPVSFVLLNLGRYVGLIAAHNMERHRLLGERVAVIAHHTQSDAALEQIRHLGGNLTGLVVPGGGEVPRNSEVPVLGHTSRLGEVINAERISRLVLVDQSLSEQEIRECSVVAKRMGVVMTRIIGFVEHDSQAEVLELYGLRVLQMRPRLFTRKQELVKRTFDIVSSAAMLLLLLPVLAAIAILVKASSRGPVLYCSRRVGRGGRHFTFLKFRTMYTGTDRKAVAALNEKGGHLFKIRKDPRVTPVGRLLRRWSLDELPQLINVLLGEMSMVGPRPLPASDLDPDGQSTEFCAWAEQRSRVSPGITGLWQIRGRSDLPFEKMVELDVEYIRDWSLPLDLRILLETPIVMVTGRGAY